MDTNCTIILAGGKGTRMKSGKPKVMCEVLFKPMIDWVIDSAEDAGAGDICVVTGHLSELLVAHLGGKYKTVYQADRLGTGHAVMQAVDFISEHKGNVLILNGDAPLMDTHTISGALNYHIKHNNAVTVISAQVSDPTGYGRIVRDKGGFLQCITEEKDADAQTKSINEVNSGAYWIKADVLLDVLSRIKPSPVTGEYYLTEAIALVISDQLPAAAYTAATEEVVMGANDRVQLLDLNKRALRSVLVRHMKNGLNIPCDDGVIVGPDVEFGEDTVVMPGSIVRGVTKIGSNVVIGPNCMVIDSVIGDNTVLKSSWCDNTTIGSNCTVGPYVNLRPGTKISNGTHIGNFVELKNSEIGENTKISHLTYIGDAEVGEDVNIGCGCVTVNYNGKEKQRTVIKGKAFIGCNTNLVAPVSVGEGAYIAAGSTVTEDVPDNALAIARSKQENKENWVSRNM